MVDESDEAESQPVDDETRRAVVDDRSKSKSGRVVDQGDERKSESLQRRATSYLQEWRTPAMIIGILSLLSAVVGIVRDQAADNADSVPPVVNVTVPMPQLGVSRAPSRNCPPQSSPETLEPGDFEVVAEAQRIDDYGCWSQEVSPIAPGSNARILVGYKNTSDVVQRLVAVRVSLPVGTNVIPNTTKLFNSTSEDGLPDDTENVANGGIIVGSFAPGANTYVAFQLAIPHERNLECGRNELHLVGAAKPEGASEHYSALSIVTYRSC